MALKNPPPFPFVLDLLYPLEIRTRAMFGALGVYVDEKICFILRDKNDYPKDSGVWVATSFEHHESLMEDFPSLRGIYIFGATDDSPTGWLNLPKESPTFEEEVRSLVEAVKRGDPRIGKVPKRKKLAKSRKVSKKKKIVKKAKTKKVSKKKTLKRKK